jgi:hypothetical protein
VELKQIDALMLKKAFIAGAKSLEAKKEWINELNVFPVPDGDTGTNMTMTIMSAAKEVAGVEEVNFENICKAISSGSLRGARGNSGVILSQLLRGFTRVVKSEEIVDVKILADALVKATETAYKAVMKPKEGTILTVAKGISDKAVEIVEQVDDILEFINILVEHGDYVLSTTPDILPVLKQAGVVDSGGQGLMQILKGVRACLAGEELDLSIEPIATVKIDKGSIDLEHIDTADIKFGYCTEFIIKLEKEVDEEEEDKLKDFLESIGDSIVCVADDEVIKIHVHTNDPGLALQKALTYGQLSKIKIDNMREEHEERLIKDSLKIAKIQAKERKEKHEKQTEQKDVGFIAVLVGEGLKDIFEGIGVDYIIEGGQTMNPSTEDILDAISKVNAKTIYILPNNKNIILAANQAANIEEDKKILVIPSKTIPQGISAVINYIPEKSDEENLTDMIAEMDKIKTLSVTYAVRDTNIDGFEIANGDIMGIGDVGMLAVGKSKEDTTVEALEKLIDENSELVTVYYGEDISEEEANILVDKIESKFEGIELDLQYGGQAVYYYIISVE